MQNSSFCWFLKENIAWFSKSKSTIWIKIKQSIFHTHITYGSKSTIWIRVRHFTLHHPCLLNINNNLVSRPTNNLELHYYKLHTSDYEKKTITSQHWLKYFQHYFFKSIGNFLQCSTSLIDESTLYSPKMDIEP